MKWVYKPVWLLFFCLLTFSTTGLGQKHILLDLSRDTYDQPEIPENVDIEIKRKESRPGTPDPVELISGFGLFDANIPKRADLSNIICDSPMGMTNIQFQANTTFYASRFKFPVLFFNVRFDSVMFARAVFERSCAFFMSRFRSATQLQGATFNSSVLFLDTYFGGNVNFSIDTFRSETRFIGCTFDKRVSFRNVHFRGKLTFSNLIVTPNTVFDFAHAVLPDTFDLSNNRNIFMGSSEMIDLTLADPLPESPIHKMDLWQKAIRPVCIYLFPNDTFGTYKKCKVNLYNTDVSRIKIDHAHFKFYAQDDTDKRILSKDVIGSIYEGLLRNFKDRGQMESYKMLDIEYRRSRDELAPNDFSLQDWWWRYGYEKWRIFIHAFVFILLFSIINFFCLHMLNDKTDGVYFVDEIPEFSPLYVHNNRKLGRVVRRFWYACIYTSVIFFLLTLKIDKLRFSKPGVVWIIFIYTVGLICMGFMANLVLQR